MKTKKYLSIIAILLFIFTYNYSVYAVTQSDVDNLKKQKEEEQAELKNIQNEKATQTNELDTINEKISTLSNEISELEIKLDELKSSIKLKEEDIEKKEKDIEQKQELLKTRLVAMYINGSISYLDVLFGSNNYIDMIASYDAVKEITDADTALINQVADEKKAIEKEKAELEEKKTETETVKAEKDSKNDALKVVQQEKKEKVATLSQDEKDKQAEIDATDAKIKAAESEMARIFRQLEEERQRQNSSSSSSGSSSGSGAAGLNFDGSFIWPCDCKIVTSRMKWRWGRQHKGIDIGASYANVYASASGYCYNAYDSGGYGNYIMIFHGSGYVTLYGHLNYSMVSNGQYVSQGQVIAQSGNTGGSTGPHLHFEIRQASSASDFFSKSPMDPLNYLPGGYTIYE